MNSGVRFSMNASGPSLASSLMKTCMPICESIRIASLSGRHSVSRSARSTRLHRDRPVGGDHLRELAGLVERLPSGTT